mgnify:CR=1 FL=1
MKYIEWDTEKGVELLRERGISFGFCAVKIEGEDVVDILENNPNYPHQKIFVLEINNYIYLVPFVEDKEKIFLKTIYPSRKFTKIYLKK